MNKKPNFFVVGAMRSATTSLHEYLRVHPQIFIPRHKEPQFFTKFPSNSELGSNPTLENYLELFKDVKDEIAIGEVSPDYLLDPDSAQKIHDFNPNSKIIMILRDPIERAFSHYLHTKFKWGNLSFYEKILKDSKDIDQDNPNSDNVLVYGMYFNQIKKYTKIFGNQNVKIVIYDEMFPDKIDEKIEEILIFLGLDKKLHNFSKEGFNRYYNSRKKLEKIMTSAICKKIGYTLFSEKARRKILMKIREKNVDKPEMTDTEIIFLKKIFKSDIEELENDLNRKLPWK